MFLNDLNIEERCAFLEMAYHLAYADGDLALPEAQMLGCYRVELELWEDVYPIQGIPLIDAAAIFQQEHTKRAVLMELMMIAMADGVAHPSEHALLVQVQQVMGLDAETSDRQFGWVQRLAALIATGKRMIDVGDPYATAH